MARSLISGPGAGIRSTECHSSYCLVIIENLFSGCCSCINIKWGNSWSTEFEIGFGVRQGSVLSPFLFAIYCEGLCFGVFLLVVLMLL